MLVLIFIVLVNAFLGIAIFTRNSRVTVNRLFLALTISIICWCIASYLTDHAAYSQRLFWGKIAFVMPVFVTLALVFLFRFFPVKLKTTRKSVILINLIGMTGIVLSLTNCVVDGDRFIKSGTVLKPGPLYYVFVAIELVLLGYAAKSYLQSRAHSGRLQRTQATFVATGFLIGFFWALVFSVLLPVFVKSWNPAAYGPLGTVIFVSLTAYAIIRHHLFDIRLLIARSLAYTLSLLTVGGLFVAITFLLGDTFIDRGDNFTNHARLIYTVLVIIFALLFPYLKKLFDRLTNSIFYQDSYDPQFFIDQLNKEVINNIELAGLLSHTAKVIEQNIKCTRAVFTVQTSSQMAARSIGSAGTYTYKISSIDEINQAMSLINNRIIVYDELENSQAGFRRLLHQNDIAVLANLEPSLKTEEAAIAYLTLGPKKSGNAYTVQDIRTVEIIASVLTIAIQNSLRFEEIQSFNATLQDKVNRATRNLTRANHKLEALDLAKDDFISMASHQLRTPLTAVKGYVSLVMEGDSGKITAPQYQLLGQAFASSQRMVDIISDLLNVSRLRTGKFVMESTPVNLANVVEQELAQLQDAAAARSLKLIYKKPKAFPELMLDDTKTRQVIMNFVDNAIYYTPAKGKITVTLEDKPASIELRIKDNGIGVPRHEQAHLFAKFYRAQNARKARPDGTGLGLFMARKVIASQHGSIIFESKEGQGSTFGFMINKAKLLKLPNEIKKVTA